MRLWRSLPFWWHETVGVGVAFVREFQDLLVGALCGPVVRRKSLWLDDRVVAGQRSESAACLPSGHGLSCRRAVILSKTGALAC